VNLIYWAGFLKVVKNHTSRGRFDRADLPAEKNITWLARPVTSSYEKVNT